MCCWSWVSVAGDGSVWLELGQCGWRWVSVAGAGSVWLAILCLWAATCLYIGSAGAIQILTTLGACLFSNCIFLGKKKQLHFFLLIFHYWWFLFLPNTQLFCFDFGIFCYLIWRWLFFYFTQVFSRNYPIFSFKGSTIWMCAMCMRKWTVCRLSQTTEHVKLEPE